jgi:rhomboid protease GluP
MGSLFSVTRGHSTSMGASGAVYGLIGFLLVYAIKFGDMNQVSQLIFIIGINVVLAFAPGSRLDNWGHAGGFVGGIVCSFVMIGLKFFGVL